MKRSDRIVEWLSDLPVIGWFADRFLPLSDEYWREYQRQATLRNQVAWGFLDAYREHLENKDESEA